MQRKHFAYMVACSILALAASGCAQIKYASVPTGTFGGKVNLVWIGPDQFIYEKDATDPLYFQRSNGQRIVPEKMYTDGGSIPRPMWVFRNYSPWSYGPAFVIHDWLFDAHHCHIPGYETYTVDEAAEVMAECQKTLMETQKAPKSESTLYLMNVAVRTKIAANLWNTGKCIQPQDVSPLLAAGRPTIRVYWDLDQAAPPESVSP